MRHAPLLAIGSTLLAAALPAQLGTRNGINVAVQTAVPGAYNAYIGAARDNQGNYWVTSGGRATRPPILAKLDAQGNHLKTIVLPATYQSSSFGFRDLAFHPAKNLLYMGIENTLTANKILAFDVATEQFVPSEDFTGPSALSSGVSRGLAFDPLGDNGNGSMYVDNFGSVIYEIRKNGSVIRSFAVPSSGSTYVLGQYGLAIDIVNRRLWNYAQGQTTRPSGIAGQPIGSCVFEFDISGSVATPTWTKTMFLGDLATITGNANTPPGGIAGGTEFYVKNGKPTLLLLAQGSSSNGSQLYEVDATFAYGTGCGGRIGMDGDAAYSGNANWQVTLGQSSAGSAVLMIGGGEQTPALPLPPILGSGCALNVALAPTPVLILSPVTVVNNSASMPLGIPAGITGSLYLQWIELPAVPAFPFTASQGAKVNITP